MLSLSILVAVHEFGHFLFSRIFKVRVEKFYLFFDAGFSLFKFKPKNSDTEYGIGWLPLGGYCKIAGMIDESMDKEQMKLPPKAYEFRSKPAYQRLLIMVAGVVFNFLLALFIYSMILFSWGDTYLPVQNMDMGMYYSETAQHIGFQDGDILQEADGVKLKRFDQFSFRKIIEAKQVTVLRDGQKENIAIPDDMMERLMHDKKGFAGVRYPMIVQTVLKGKSAEAAGIQVGDQILSINGIPTPEATDVNEQLTKFATQTIQLGVKRDTQIKTLTVTPDSTGIIGIMVKAPTQIYKTVTTNYAFFASFPAGIDKGVRTLKGYISDMKYVFTKEGAKSLGGFGTIGGLFPAHWNWPIFWERTAFLSIILAFMNILPIPALDGGHVLFLLVEVVTRRKPSNKFLEYAQIGGMAILFALLLYANGNDLFRYFFN